MVYDEGTAVLRRVVADFGWPGHRLVGADAAHIAWLIAQHSRDLAFQDHVRPLLKAAVQQGDADPQQFAALSDHCCVRRNRQQIYGSQFVERDGGLQLWPVEDPACLDERRAALGLGPHAEYEARIRGGAAILSVSEIRRS